MTEKKKCWTDEMGINLNNLMNERKLIVTRRVIKDHLRQIGTVVESLKNELADVEHTISELGIDDENTRP